MQQSNGNQTNQMGKAKHGLSQAQYLWVADVASGTTRGEGLIRDDRGNWIMGSTRKIHKANSFLTETWALRDGLLLCNQLNLNAVMVKLDAKSLVDALKNPSYANTIVSSLFDDRRRLAA